MHCTFTSSLPINIYHRMGSFLRLFGKEIGKTYFSAIHCKIRALLCSHYHYIGEKSSVCKCKLVCQSNVAMEYIEVGNE